MLTRSGWATGVTMALCVVGAVAFGYPQLVALATACGVALTIAGVWTMARPRLRLIRHLDRTRVTVGDDLEGTIEVTNDGRRPTGGSTASDVIGSQIVSARIVDVALPSLGIGSSASVPYRFRTSRRGLLTVGPLTVSRADPLGLTRSSSSSETTDLVWVYPRTYPVEPMSAGLQLSPEGASSEFSPQGAMTFHSLREYVIGDDLRHIHWRSTARTGTLMMRRYLDTTLPVGVVMLDDRGDVHTEESFEAAVEVAASLALASARNGLPIRLVTTSGLNLDGREASERNLLDHLTAIEMGSHDSLAELARRLVRPPGRGAVVLVTGTPMPTDLATFNTVGRRFRRAALVRVDPDLGAADGDRLGGSAMTTYDVSGALDFAQQWNSQGR